MTRHDLTFRPATIHDATFVATIMMEAVGLPVMERAESPRPDIVELCRRSDTLYSYRNAIIAQVGGTLVGGLISYDGHGYHETKRHTFSLVTTPLDFDPTTMDDETRQGEYYLDSAAVLPSYRGQGLGRLIIEQGVAMARERNLQAVLACDPHNAGALALYTNIGFKQEGEMFIFGHQYLRMVFPTTIG